MKQNVDQIFPKYETEWGSLKAHQWFPEDSNVLREYLQEEPLPQQKLNC